MSDIRPIWLAAIAIASTALLAVLEIHAGFSLWDEGFLWYGSQRVLHGEVPIRDFQAYDPGRYYWSAAFMGLLQSDGIIVTRLAAYAFQAMGIAALLWSAKADRLPGQRRILSLLLALSLLWMFPRHKLFDAASCLLLIAGMAAWLRTQGYRPSFMLGVLVGLIACVGRNHGVYGALASVALVLTAANTHLKARSVLYLALGIVTGYLPLLLMLVFAPGLLPRFIESITILFEIRATNLPIPVPWPWDLQPGSAPRDAIAGVYFLLLATVPVLAIVYCVLGRNALKSMPATMVAAAFLSLPYAHFAFSRADINHLAQGVLPTLVFAAIWMTRVRRELGWVLLAALASGVLVMLPMHPGWSAWRERWQSTDLAGERIRLPESGRREVAALQKVLKDHVAPGQAFVATPYWPGAYALARRRSPMWEIYALVPRTPAFEQQEIARIEESNPQLVLLMDYPIDGLEERRLRHTHPMLYDYLRSHFSQLPDEPGLAGTLLLTPRQESGGT